MNLKRAKVLPYRLRLRRPLLLATGQVIERSGFLLRIEGDDEQAGYGEASPAWWSGGDSLEATRRDLDWLASRLNEGGFCSRRLHDALCRRANSADEHEQQLARAILGGSRAALCAIDTALLDLHARHCNLSFAELLGATERGKLECNALVVEANPDEAAAAAAALVERGFRTIKMKVAALPLKQDIARIEAVRHACKGKVRLRLDANRSWNSATARRALAALAEQDLDYVEEPLMSASPEELRQLRQATNVAIALDESIFCSEDIVRFASAEACDAVVIKLARVGGPSRALEMARVALKAGLAVVCTDSIETAIGRAAALHTAAALPGSPAAVGLGGSTLLDGDVTREESLPHQPLVEVRGPGLGPIELNRSLQ